MDSDIRLSYAGLLKNHFGLIAAAYLAVFTGNLGQSFYIGLFRTDISEYLNISAGEFGSIYAVITMISGCLVMRVCPKIDWHSPRLYGLREMISLNICW